MKKHFFVYLLLSLFISVQLLAGEEPDLNMGKKEGGRAAIKDVNKICWVGAGLTMIGVGAAMIWRTSEPDPAEFVGKSPEYVKSYTESYNSRVKRERLIFSSLGCSLTLFSIGLVALANESCDAFDWGCLDPVFGGTCLEADSDTEAESCIGNSGCLENSSSGGSSCVESSSGG